MASGKVRAKVDKASGDTVMYNDVAVRSNSAVIEYCRTSMAALGGSTAGILGFTGLYGFLFFLLCNVTLWLLLLLKAGISWNRFFVSRRSLLTSGLFSGMFTYVLFWVFLFGMVHVY
ncbi:ER membrane protein complex subunit 6 [Amphibalanus amphitrite]|uniref:ER membrane protein complex subunit 6 n=1 Tax=Amphibalanus amphitrite TaxID=1232801 RepID=A0A6A4X6C3_AMPAM|nr:ER membrane protein complex subunit 6-like [Amphibalanus amphitrite]XP_043214732.1 ER membrane protein complex subunit 6-like [Amphibalanus amphitrite]XP_043214733.1 ER membrane protein complex subunit 6-like [Amphibalanus amphitrite]XP_043214734.1 ER membrane protein complex subunit 6-like [Amphibalanus amphitrite]KAF0309852.1 ER membrane protein complex subunit 6 [Amphibalanus amphitrite]